MTKKAIIDLPSSLPATKKLCTDICEFLEQFKAENVISIALEEKSSIADFLIIASGRSQMHIKSLAEKLKEQLHRAALSPISIEGLEQCDWVLVDAGDLIVHLFRPEVREFYNLEKMWMPSFGQKIKRVSS